MRKILTSFLITFGFFLVFFQSAPPVFSQAANQRWVCLSVERCDKVESCKNAIPPEYPLVTHMGLLSSSNKGKPLPNSETYIVECIATTEGQICTTGKKETDDIIFGVGNGRIEKLVQLLNYKFKHLWLINGSSVSEISNPVMTNASGDIGPIVWHDGTYTNIPERKFLALNYFNPIPQTGTGEAASQQIGTFSFEEVMNKTDCVSIRWDPYGRVFDTKSLEPVKGATVSLLKKRNDNSFTLLNPNEVLGGNLENPQNVAEDGLFSFVVPDGTYKLKASKVGYVFPVSDLATINSNYTKIYNNIYPAETGEEIVQQGSIQHRDIPFEKNTGSTNGIPKLMEYFYEVEPLTQTISIEGRVSHPFTDISFWSYIPSGTNQKKLGRELLKTRADKLGNFKVEIDTSNFDKSKAEYFGLIRLKKNDLTLITNNKNTLFDRLFSIFTDFIFKKTSAAEVETNELSLEPIPTFLEGYAYDSIGTLLPNATVKIYEKLSTIPYFQTKADETGYYKVSSNSLPTSPYEIQYISAVGTVSRITTSKFIVQNQKYLSENNTNLYVFKNNEGKIVNKDSITAAAQNQNNKNTPTPVSQLNQQKFSKLFITIIILIFLMVAFVVSYFLYFRKKTL
ncbi:MAG: carboxypeptidase-like regulatory domain-containing protein [Candidatus Roizmanbacteria bacterium]